MIFKKHCKHMSIRIRLIIGQVSLAVAIVMTRVIQHRSAPLPDFPAGFLHGIAGVLFGVSIVFNLSLLPQIRKHFDLSD